jgi:hypothetical protein
MLLVVFHVICVIILVVFHVINMIILVTFSWHVPSNSGGQIDGVSLERHQPHFWNATNKIFPTSGGMCKHSNYHAQCLVADLEKFISGGKSNE